MFRYDYASVDATSEPLGVYAVAFGSRFDTVQPGQLSTRSFELPLIKMSFAMRSFDVAQVGAELKVSCGITAKS